MPRWIHTIFVSIWAGTAIVFACLAYGAYGGLSTSLTRLPIPQHGADIEMGGLSLSKAIVGLATVNNENVTTLEESIRSSARFSF
jgi:hypothetical protein